MLCEGTKGEEDGKVEQKARWLHIFEKCMPHTHLYPSTLNIYNSQRDALDRGRFLKSWMRYWMVAMWATFLKIKESKLYCASEVKARFHFSRGQRQVEGEWGWQKQIDGYCCFLFSLVVKNPKKKSHTNTLSHNSKQFCCFLFVFWHAFNWQGEMVITFRSSTCQGVWTPNNALF